MRVVHENPRTAAGTLIDLFVIGLQILSLAPVPFSLEWANGWDELRGLLGHPDYVPSFREDGEW